MKKKKPLTQPDDAASLRYHGLPVSSVDGDRVTFDTPPTEAQVAFASQLLGRKVQST